MEQFLEEVRIAAKKNIVYTEHALDEMNAEEEIISYEEVRDAIFKGQIIEDYCEDRRGHSCLIFHYTSKDRPLHIVCSPKEDYLGMITAYIPTLDRWEEDFKRRRGQK